MNRKEKIDIEKVERLKILMAEKELQLKVEGRSTNLRIWYSTHHLTPNQIFFRLDMFQQYSTPLSHAIAKGYLQENHEAIGILNKEYKFGQKVSIADLNRIIEITIDMKQRKVRDW